jgi:hypothetical protein
MKSSNIADESVKKFEKQQNTGEFAMGTRESTV